MKKLFEITRRGYSYHNTHRYYLCDSIDEYNKEYQKAKDAETSWKRVYGESSITEEPHTVDLDGFKLYGGKKFEAVGFTVHWVSGCQTDYSSFDHFIKPDTIVRDENVNSEGHW